jgi:hypothetical protein
MPHEVLRFRSPALIAGLAFAVASCGDPYAAKRPEQVPPPAAAIPLSNKPAPPENFAPAHYEIPIRRPVAFAPPPWGPQDYSYIDEGYWLSDALFDAPPDYAVNYAGVYPWVWVTAGGFTVIVEPVFDGDRYYYFHPGVDLPFFVADPVFSYAFDTNGALAVVYNRDGRALPDAFARREGAIAAGILARAYALQTAARPTSVRLAPSAQDWAVRRRDLATTLARWSRGVAQTPEWTAWRNQHAGQIQAAFSSERFTREAEAARLDRRARQPQLAAQEWSRAQQSRTLAQASQPRGFQGFNPFARKPVQTARASAPAETTLARASAPAASAKIAAPRRRTLAHTRAVASGTKAPGRFAVNTRSGPYAAHSRAPMRTYARPMRLYARPMPVYHAHAAYSPWRTYAAHSSHPAQPRYYSRLYPAPRYDPAPASHARAYHAATGYHAASGYHAAATGLHASSFNARGRQGGHQSHAKKPPHCNRDLERAKVRCST